VPEMGFWLEIVTLVIPGFNDSEDELEPHQKSLHEWDDMGWPAMPLKYTIRRAVLA